MAPKLSQKEIERRLQAYLDHAREVIATHGHYVQGIFGGAATPPWSYTVGCSQRGAAELVIIGMPPDLAQDVLNEIVKLLKTREIPDGEDLAINLNVPVRLRTLSVDDTWPRMRPARALLEVPPTCIRQVIWPDPDGKFPGDPAYRMLIQQTLEELDEPTPD